MFGRSDRSNLVLISIENSEHDRCVDLFIRADESYGFGEFRRDPEDRGAWTAIGVYPNAAYSTREAALSAAQQMITWLQEAIKRSRFARDMLSQDQTDVGH